MASVLQDNDYEGIDRSIPDEDEKIRELLKNDFHTLATHIKQLTDSALDLLEKGRREEHISPFSNEDVYVNFTAEQDMRFDEELSRINETIAQAQASLDFKFRPELSMPQFKNYQNVFYDLYTYIKIHTEGEFYQGHIMKNNKYLYPYFPIRSSLRDMRQLIARVSGVLRVVGDYFTYPVSIQVGAGSREDEYYDNSQYRTGAPRKPAPQEQPRYMDIGAPR